jgi:oxygen-independent coproporphyrinogen-3 oxidase
MRPYAAAVVGELRSLSPWLEGAPVKTLYVGGGTPSLLPPALLAEIIDAASAVPEAEVTIEANPGTLGPDSLSEIRAAGCNRLSIGMQSVHNDELELLGRIHKAGTTNQAVRWAREAGFGNLGLDLIYGIPYQSVERWAETIRTALSLLPEHLSLYALSIEPGTVFDRWIKRGRLPRPDPDQAAEMYEFARDELEMAGYLHYEISNWALPGYQSEHNLAYWRNCAYLGIGASAWGHWLVGDTSWRLRNVRDPQVYIARVGCQEATRGSSLPVTPACMEQEFVPRLWAMAETMFMGLRLVREGVVRFSFCERFGIDPVDHYRLELKRLRSQGWLDWDDEAIRLSREGVFVSNQILAEFLPS